MKLLLAPHNDDESLFAAFTILRERPLVVICTDSYVQFERGDNISAGDRILETKRAMDILGASVAFLGIKDTEISMEVLRERLKVFGTDCKVYAPAIQGGHLHHDLVGRVAQELYKDATFYSTYTKTDLAPEGTVEIKPTQNETDLKLSALSCYESQIRINRPHFDAVANKSEWYVS